MLDHMSSGSQLGMKDLDLDLALSDSKVHVFCDPVGLAIPLSAIRGPCG